MFWLEKYRGSDVNLNKHPRTSDLFGCFKQPFQGLSGLHLDDKKVTWKKLASGCFLVFFDGHGVFSVHQINKHIHACFYTHILLPWFTHYFFSGWAAKEKMWYGFLLKRTNTAKWRLTWESLWKESLNTKSCCFSVFNTCTCFILVVNLSGTRMKDSSCLSWRIAGPRNSNSNTLLPKKCFSKWSSSFHLFWVVKMQWKKLEFTCNMGETLMFNVLVNMVASRKKKTSRS